jgi:hypothetical protein
MPESLDQWLIRSNPSLHPVVSADSRFLAVESGQGPAALAALDEFIVAGEVARSWIKENPCPESTLGDTLLTYIDARLEQAELVLSYADPSFDEDAARARSDELLEIVEQAGVVLEHWNSKRG